MIEGCAGPRVFADVVKVCFHHANPTALQLALGNWGCENHEYDEYLEAVLKAHAWIAHPFTAECSIMFEPVEVGVVHGTALKNPQYNENDALDFGTRRFDCMHLIYRLQHGSHMHINMLDSRGYTALDRVCYMGYHEDFVEEKFEKYFGYLH